MFGQYPHNMVNKALHFSIQVSIQFSAAILLMISPAACSAVYSIHKCIVNRDDMQLIASAVNRGNQDRMLNK